MAKIYGTPHGIMGAATPPALDAEARTRVLACFDRWGDPATDGDAIVRAVEHALDRYREALAFGANDIHQPRKTTLAELDRLLAGLDAIGGALAGLSDETRDRLTEWVRSAAAHPEDGIFEWGPVVPDDLVRGRLARECGMMRGRVAGVRESVAAEVRDVGHPGLAAETMLAVRLADAWHDFTGRKPPRGGSKQKFDASGKEWRAPWPRFVECVFSVAGIAASPLERAAEASALFHGKSGKTSRRTPTNK